MVVSTSSKWAYVDSISPRAFDRDQAGAACRRAAPVPRTRCAAALLYAVDDPSIRNAAMANHRHDSAAHRWFGRRYDELHAAEREAVEHAASRRLLSADTNAQFTESLTFGERLADRVARFGGSWTFILLFAGALVAWAVLNAVVLLRPFDPYPFIFLNLLLSMLAAVQAPVIMMSQNRQAAKDRLDAEHDYAVNLKAEMEIMALHDKLDALRTEQLQVLIEKQADQLLLVQRLLERIERNEAP
jgi:uncharacterized membrane protein